MQGPRNTAQACRRPHIGLGLIGIAAFEHGAPTDLRSATSFASLCGMQDKRPPAPQGAPELVGSDRPVLVRATCSWIFARERKGCDMSRKRELIEPHKGDKRYIRRDERGRITESDDVGRSLTQDRRRKAKTVAKPGQGDKGDRPRKS